MEFQLTEEQQQLREAARRYVRDKLPPVAEELEETNQAPSRELIKDFARMGFLGINVPEKFGGLGLGNLEALIVLEEFAQVSSAVAFPVFESIVGPVRAIERFGDPQLANEVVPAVCSGEKMVAVSMSEPQAGTALTDLKTRAEVKGDTVVVNGTKRWCSGGGHADGYVVYCRMSDDPGARGIGAVYIEKDTPGLSFGAPEICSGFAASHLPTCIWTTSPYRHTTSSCRPAAFANSWKPSTLNAAVTRPWRSGRHRVHSRTCSATCRNGNSSVNPLSSSRPCN